MSRAPAVMARIVIPRGRSAAEQRLAAIAALHQPVVGSGEVGALVGPTCPQCKSCWPCATALLLGAWPGDEETACA